MARYFFWIKYGSNSGGTPQGAQSAQPQAGSGDPPSLPPPVTIKAATIRHRAEAENVSVNLLTSNNFSFFTERDGTHATAYANEAAAFAQCGLQRWKNWSENAFYCLVSLDIGP